MSTDFTLVAILAIGTIVLNKDIILSEWFATKNEQDAGSQKNATTAGR